MLKQLHLRQFWSEYRWILLGLAWLVGLALGYLGFSIYAIENGEVWTAGDIMIPARSDESAFEFPGAHLESLAEKEHIRWMNKKFEAGWKYASTTDKKKHLHAALVPWAGLSEEDKEKDRVMVRQIPDILAHAGYTIVSLRD